MSKNNNNGNKTIRKTTVRKTAAQVLSGHPVTGIRINDAKAGLRYESVSHIYLDAMARKSANRVIKAVLPEEALQEPFWNGESCDFFWQTAKASEVATMLNGADDRAGDALWAWCGRKSSYGKRDVATLLPILRKLLGDADNVLALFCLKAVSQRSLSAAQVLRRAGKVAAEDRGEGWTDFVRSDYTRTGSAAFTAILDTIVDVSIRQGAYRARDLYALCDKYELDAATNALVVVAEQRPTSKNGRKKVDAQAAADAAVVAEALKQ